MQQQTKHTHTFQNERTGMVQLIKNTNYFKSIQSQGWVRKVTFFFSLNLQKDKLESPEPGLSWHHFPIQITVQSLYIKPLSLTCTGQNLVNSDKMKRKKTNKVNKHISNLLKFSVCYCLESVSAGLYIYTFSPLSVFLYSLIPNKRRIVESFCKCEHQREREI